MDCFKLIFDEEMARSIVISTNLQRRKEKGDDFREINIDEFWAYLGLMILRGVYRSSGESVEELWSKTDGRAVFPATMPLSTFTEIRRTLRFDNTNTRQARLRNDKLAANRLLLNGFNANSKATYVLSDCVTIDEQLYSFRGRCRYVQYIPSKPAKYGLKFWLLCDSSSYFIHGLDMYIGRDDERGNVPLGLHVTMKMTDSIAGSGRNVTADNFFVSLDCARQLRQRNLTLVGTVRKNLREVPDEMRTVGRRPVLTTDFRFNVDDNTCLLMYAAKKNKPVLLMSTLHKTTDVSEQTLAKKPHVIEYYNSTKSGVDAADERIGTYTVKYRSCRWHTVVFCNIVDASAFNAYVLHCESKPDWTKRSCRRRLFLKELGKQLSSAYREHRTANAALHPAARIAAERLQGAEVVDVGCPKYGRCSICPRERDRKVKQKCVNCQKVVCVDHSDVVCKTCSSQ